MSLIREYEELEWAERADLRISTEPRELNALGPGEAVIVRLVGEASVLNIDRLTMTFTRVAAVRPRRVVIDMTYVKLVSNLALGALAVLRRNVERGGGDVVLVGWDTKVVEPARNAGMRQLVRSATGAATCAA
jgi:anti-anti-sigma factor